MAAQTEREVLNQLIEACRDAERGFRKAADHVHSPAAKELFLDLAGERAGFAADLLPHAYRRGGASTAEGSAAATLHRGWMDVRDAWSGHDDGAMFAETERGELAAAEMYHEALDSVLPPAARDLVEHQYVGVKEAYLRIRLLERTAARDA